LPIAETCPYGELLKAALPSLVTNSPSIKCWQTTPTPLLCFSSFGEKAG